MTIMRLSTITDPYVRPDGTRRHHKGNRYAKGERAGLDSFIAIDGEGIATPAGHKYVLLGIGDDQIDNPDGLHWTEIFDFLYGHYQPKTAFVGFYLGYDFTQWLRTFPQERAARLLTIDGKESRRSRSPKLKGKFLPVDIDDWQVDMIGHKRMQIRPHVCDCPTVKCGHKQAPWLYICDAGGFFQTAFVNVIDPGKWHDPILTDTEHKIILAGKAHRPDASLDTDMRRYNALENNVFQRVMSDLNRSLQQLGIKLPASNWYGPGQAAQAWLRLQDAPTGETVRKHVPDAFINAARASYFGGWFEIMAHGIIPETCYEYDINSAYPKMISELPCLLHGRTQTGTGPMPKLSGRQLGLVKTTVWARAPHSDTTKDYVGAMLHRDLAARISRPVVTAGWYWTHELDAAERAKCVTRGWRKRATEWVIYKPCDCPPPLRSIRGLYDMRLTVGKKSSLGKAAKLVMNSCYGKFAQSVGRPVFGNPIYASLITSGCRAMILDAIATHPNGKRDVVMVATDAVFFLTPHPTLPLSEQLGEWGVTARERLTLFKPGVYWDDTTRQAIADDQSPVFKARGISAKLFGRHISNIDEQFSQWTPLGCPPIEHVVSGYGWPRIKIPVDFSLVSALQACIRNRWDMAGENDNLMPDGTPRMLIQASWPGDKRERLWADTTIPGRIIYRSNPLLTGANARHKTLDNVTEWDNFEERYDSVPYEKRFGMDDPFSDEYMQEYGQVPDDSQPLRSMFRILTGQED